MKKSILMKYIYTIGILFILLFTVSACDRDAHDGEIIIPEGCGALNVWLQTEDTDISVSTIHLFIFGTDDKLQAHEYYESSLEAALHSTHLSPGNYTVMAVMNVPADFMPSSTRSDLPDISLADFNQWLNEVAAQYPEMLTGMGQTEVKEGEVQRLMITLKKGTAGIVLPILRLSLTLPDPKLPDYTAAESKTRAAEAGYVLRCVAELCKAGTDNVLLHKVVTPALQTDGTYMVELSAGEGTYDLRLWMDYASTDSPTADNYYHTADLMTVTINTEPYRANTDAKDAAYYAQSGISLMADGAEMNVQLQRPVAKYRILSTDVEAYRKLTEKDAVKYPPLEELSFEVHYQYFFPSSFNVVSGRLNDSYTGISYSGTAVAVSDLEPDNTVVISSDYVLTGPDDSFVTVILVWKDADGKVAGTAEGLSIGYRRGCLSTLTGKFLTAGTSGGGVTIDPEWGDDIIIEF